MWSIYFENVIDNCRSVKRQKQLKIVDSAIFKTFLLSGCFFRGSFFTFKFEGVFLNDADDFLSNSAKYNALQGVKVKKRQN